MGDSTNMKLFASQTQHSLALKQESAASDKHSMCKEVQMPSSDHSQSADDATLGEDQNTIRRRPEEPSARMYNDYQLLEILHVIRMTSNSSYRRRESLSVIEDTDFLIRKTPTPGVEVDRPPPIKFGRKGTAKLSLK